MNWEKVAYQLWKILDDIDTAGDMAKNDNEVYRMLVENTHRHRFIILNYDQVEKLYTKYYNQPSN